METNNPTTWVVAQCYDSPEAIEKDNSPVVLGPYATIEAAEERRVQIYNGKTHWAVLPLEHRGLTKCPLCEVVLPVPPTSTRYYTIPVAFVVRGTTEDDAAQRLCDRLAEINAEAGPEYGLYLQDTEDFDCWWMPNHPQVDGNDNSDYERLEWVKQ